MSGPILRRASALAAVLPLCALLATDGHAQRRLGYLDDPGNKLFNLATLDDLDGDGIPEIFATGYRDVVFRGSDLKVLYEVPAPYGFTAFRTGDLDGDGLDDFGMGEPSYDDGFQRAGAVHLRSSRDGSLLRTIVGPGGEFGQAACSLADVDGDGVHDLLVGAPLDASEESLGHGIGTARVLSGASGNVIHFLHGKKLSDAFGSSVAAAGDLNGDGVPDLLVGDPLDDLGPNDSGSVWVISGADGSTIHRVSGLAAGEEFGAAVLGADQDLDGDGVSDFYASGSGDPAGRVVQCSGATGQELRSLALPSSRLSWCGDLLGDGTGVIALRNGLVRSTTLDLVSNKPQVSADAFGDFDGDGRVDFVTRVREEGEMYAGDAGFLTGPQRVDVGDTLSAQLGANLGSTAGLLVVEAIDGSPTFHRLAAFAIVQGQGQVPTFVVPPGASGHYFQLVCYLFGGPQSGSRSSPLLVFVD